ncbi:MAG TPA: transposase [Caulifigura sp.]|jgi:putative transposase|nr:transposase [Caulifigura sp.]
MPNYRRNYVPGATYFFTVVTHGRRPILADPRAHLHLGNVFRECQQAWPFKLDAIVLLPDHLHCIWRLPQGDDRYSARWSWIKLEFTKRWLASGGVEGQTTRAQQREHRRGVWQPRFWEHTVKDEEDYQTRFDYIHFNPVKHGYVQSPYEWEPSSFHRWVEQGVYPRRWASAGTKLPNFSAVEHLCGEPP